MYCVVMVEVCCLNLGRVFGVAAVISVGGKVWIVEVGLCSLGVNLGL